MLHINSTNIEKEMIQFIQNWFDMIAEGKIDEACNKLDKPNCYGIKWTPEKIQDIIKDEFGLKTIFGHDHPDGVYFSAVKSTEGNYRADALKFDDGSGYSVEHDVPLNGKWSDLTAQFEFIGTMLVFDIILHDLHVL